MNEGNSILIRHGGGAWSTPETTAYSNEHHLETILRADPSRVPGVPEGSVAVSQLMTPAGPIDVCIVGSDGSLTVVECKLASNSEKRRMVMGQVLDYASAIWRMGPEAFLAAWQTRTEGNSSPELSDEQVSAVETNIQEGRISLCLAVDQIDDDLRRLVEYLNLTTRDDVAVTALQLSYARHGDVEILIPTTFGVEIVATKRKTAAKPTWTLERFLESVTNEVDRALVDDLLHRLESITDRRGPHGLLWFGLYPAGGIFFHPFGLRYSPFQLWISSAGRVMVNGNWKKYTSIAGHAGFKTLADVLGGDHQGPQQGFPLAGVDLDDFWAAALTTAEKINAAAEQSVEPLGQLGSELERILREGQQ